ncbi:MAG: hypothetical protein ACRCYA_05465 [Cetobacterium sp.]|uniref:beta barrel domain-containing protein n=1 Tax=Cetobacterium sp. TaxID=2071632 RepID=UPI003F3F2C96
MNIKLNVGDKIYTIKSKEIEEIVVEKIGIKYIYLKFDCWVYDREKKKYKDDFLKEINDEKVIQKRWFKTKEEALLTIEADEKYQNILHHIVKSYGNPFKDLSLEEIRTVYNILFKEEK